MRTRFFVRSAYDDDMEPMYLFLIFALASSDPETRERLRAFLAFYRENRDLLAAFMQNGAPMPANDPPKPGRHEESRPHDEVGKNGILEEYLSRLG